jgi:hypothetical protein
LWLSSGGQLALAVTNTADVAISFNATMRLDSDAVASVVAVTIHAGDGLAGATSVAATPTSQAKTFSFAWTLPPTSAAVLPVTVVAAK